MNEPARSGASGDPAALFILGMHRSGTSAVSGTIRLAGVPLGRASDRMAANAENPKGYWESTALTLFNEELLEALGGSWSAPPPLEPGWTSDPRIGERRALGRELVSIVHPTAPWGWKDPRNSLLMPFWREVLAVRPVVVLSHRNPLEVAESLATWRGLDESLGLALWERYVRSAIANARNLPMLVVPYAGLLSDPARWQTELRSFLAREGISSPGEAASPSRPFLDRELRHSAQTPETLERHPGVTVEQRELFRLLEAAVAESDTSRLAELPRESPGTAELFSERAAVERAQRRAKPPRASVLEGVAESEELDPLDRRRDYLARLDEDRPARHAAQARLRRALESAPPATRTSLVCAIEQADPARLARALESLRGQIDPRWELRVANAGGTHEALLAEAAASDERIVVVDGGRGAGRAAALNAAAGGARGDLVMLFDADDTLAAEAVAEITLALDQDTGADVLYADEDRIGDDGLRFDPFFKPEWSPDYLESAPYLGRPLVLRRALFEKLGGLRGGFDGAEDYDLALRATELARAVRHLPSVLYHRGRCRPLGTASPESMRRALESALERRDANARVEDAEAPGTFHVRRSIHGRPRVSIIIPFRDEPVLLERCVRSIHELAGYDRWEAALVDNRSWQPETKALLRRLAGDPQVRLLTDDSTFNWSAINNRAAAATTGELLLFLNDDVEACREDWLSAMIEHAQRDDVGAVGARLLYPNGLVQHAGLMLHGEALARHPFRFLSREEPGYFGMAKLARNVTAVTGACLMVRRELFEAVGGFDAGLPVAFNDLDFCLRLGARGYRIVYTPLAELVHHEGVSRGLRHDPAPAEEMRRRWSTEIDGERYMSPSLRWRPAALGVCEREGVR